MPRKNPMQRLREICLALPEATERVFGGHTIATFRVREKIFAMENGYDGRTAFTCKAPPGAQRILVGSDPGRFFVPRYVGPKAGSACASTLMLTGGWSPISSPTATA